ncbi:MAG: hypothetical protein ABIQ12_09395 [Opitutaceae bacterium]
MTQRIFVALLTVVIFLAGYGARVWTEPRQTVPPAPAALAQEYTAHVAQAGGAKAKNQLDRAKLVAEIEKLRPQIAAYSAQVDEINGEFEREFFKGLNPVQQEKSVANQKKRSARDAKRLAERAPLSDEDIQKAQDRPLTSIYWMVTVTPYLDMVTKEYSLTAMQQTDVRALLALRRNKFIALFDATPHPSIRLSKLVPLLERVAAQK